MFTKEYKKIFYPEDVIRKAIISYSSLVRVSCTINDNAIICSFEVLKGNTEEVINEFDNYLIEVMNTMGEA